jgi:hypothetical protein
LNGDELEFVRGFAPAVFLDAGFPLDYLRTQLDFCPFNFATLTYSDECS